MTDVTFAPAPTEPPPAPAPDETPQIFPPAARKAALAVVCAAALAVAGFMVVATSHVSTPGQAAAVTLPKTPVGIWAAAYSGDSTLITADMTEVSTVSARDAILTTCPRMATDVATAQSHLPVPDEAVNTLYTAALGQFAAAAADCQAIGAEYRAAARGEFVVATTTLAEATAALRNVKGN